MTKTKTLFSVVKAQDVGLKDYISHWLFSDQL